MIPHAMGVLKMYILSRLEILRVRTTLGTLWLVIEFVEDSGLRTASFSIIVQ